MNNIIKKFCIFQFKNFLTMPPLKKGRGKVIDLSQFYNLMRFGGGEDCSKIHKKLIFKTQKNQFKNTIENHLKPQKTFGAGGYNA